LIVRLSPFHDVVKSTTHQFLYGECRRVLDDSCIDFAFFPSEAERRRHTGIRGIRSGRKAADFNLLLISNSYAVELLNLPYMLKLAGIPYSSDERRLCNSGPLMIMGGSNALASQSVLYSETNAMVDALYIGEGENNIEHIVRELSSVPENKRREKLMSLQSAVTGLKVFGAPAAVIKKAIYQDTKRELLANAEQALFDSSEASTVRLQIAYDCPSFCTFCFEGWERKPYREIPLSQLVAAAAGLKKKTGADTLEITAFNFNTHADITALIKEMNKLYFQVNFMSQRADILAANPSLVVYETTAGKRQYTLGIEGISQRIRSYFNKNLSEETALQAITILLKEPIREIKLFYIISGLETEDDASDFRQFLAKVGSLKELYNTGIRILCSFGLLVRMPFTPLRYEKLLMTQEEWKPVVEMIRRTTEMARYEFRLTYPYDEYFLSQALVMINRYTGTVLQEMAERDLFYDQVLSEGAWNFFREKTQLDASFSAEKDKNYHFAFDFIDCHTPADFLYQRFLDAKNGKEMPMCLGTKCNGCNACNDSQRTFLGNHTIAMPSRRDLDEVSVLIKAKAQAEPIYLITDIPEIQNHVRNETKEAALMRQLITAIDEGVTTVMTVRDALFGGKMFEGRLPHWYGKTVYAVYPFSNAHRQGLFHSLQNAGFMVSDSEIIPEHISIELSDISVTDSRQLEKTASDILDNMHMPFILSRKDGTTYFTIVPKAMKKHIVSECHIKAGIIYISGSCKLDLSSIRKSSFTAKISF